MIRKFLLILLLLLCACPLAFAQQGPATLSGSTDAGSLTGVVAVANGGTGLATLTAHALYVGNGADAPNAVAVCGTGTLVYGQVGADPICSTTTWPNAATTGDLLTATSTNSIGVVAAVASGQVLISNGTTTAPTYSASPALTAPTATTSQSLIGANGQVMLWGRLTELTTIASGVTTQATAIQIPADAIVYAVSTRTTVQPGNTTTMVVTATTSLTEFQKGASVSSAANTTDPGTKNAPVNYNGTAAQTVTFTFDASTNNASGRVRVDIYYYVITPATS